ncbi:MAG: hypothetical protein DRQ44_00810 [Gammaproteobacteria bacterium]|nr:MAG: hypothetical protein DRQ44_00810 [Gammaproteobacteria bacterium]
MNRAQASTTCRETTYTDAGNADIASLHGCNLLGHCKSRAATSMAVVARAVKVQNIQGLFAVGLTVFFRLD